jgi:hypothetical protein
MKEIGTEYRVIGNMIHNMLEQKEVLLKELVQQKEEFEKLVEEELNTRNFEKNAINLLMSMQETKTKIEMLRKLEER